MSLVEEIRAVIECGGIGCGCDGEHADGDPGREWEAPDEEAATGRSQQLATIPLRMSERVMSESYCENMRGSVEVVAMVAGCK